MTTGILVPAEWIQAAAVLVSTRGWRWVDAYGAVLALAVRLRISDDAHDVVSELGIAVAEGALEGVGLLSAGRIIRPGKRARGPRAQSGDLFPPDSPAVVPWSREAGADYRERFQGVVPYGVIGKALKEAVAERGWEVVRPAWRRFLAAQEPRFVGPGLPWRFAQTLGRWLQGPAVADEHGAGARAFLERRRASGGT